MKAIGVALFGKCPAERGPGCGFDHRDARNFAQIRHGSGCPRVDFDHIGLVAFDHKLDIHQAHNMQRLGQTRCIGNNLVEGDLLDGLRWIDRHRVAGMDSRPLNMLHYPWQQAPALPIGNDIHFRFFPDDIPVH